MKQSGEKAVLGSAQASVEMRPSLPLRLARHGYGLFLTLLGITLSYLGVVLLREGGSPYYGIAGVAIAISGILLFRGDRRGAWLYALMLAGTLLWSLWEVGLDGWALVPRLGLWMVLGLWLLTPWAYGRRATGGNILAMLAALLVAGLFLAVMWHRAETLDTPSELSPQLARTAAAEDGEWRNYGNDAGGSRFSPLSDIGPGNVGKLQVAWTYQLTRTTDPSVPKTLEVTPLIVGDSLYVCNEMNDVIALDPETGKQKWVFHARTNMNGVVAGTCRGVAYYKDPSAIGLCAERIITATVDARLVAVDARRGVACSDFGKNGVVNLTTGMGQVDPGYYFVTSAPQIARGNIVVGGWISDNQYVGEPSGVIRGFDARTGLLAWAFDMGRLDRRGLPPEGETYTPGTPNSWGPMSADEQLGLVYVPTGASTPDWFGGKRRPFDETYANSVVALDAATGAVRWSFQTSHHDIWDYDVASQPVLVDLPTAGGPVAGLIQPTKRGEVFLLDRRTGKPIAEVMERRVPVSHVPGERASPTQPFSTGMPSFAGAPLTEAAMWGLTPIDQAVCRIEFRRSRYEGPMTPVELDQPSIIYPSPMGGMNWGSVSVDRDRDIMIVNSNNMALRSQLVRRAVADALGVKPLGRGGHFSMNIMDPQAGTPYAVQAPPFLSNLGIPCQQPPFGMISAVDLKTRKLLWSHPFGTGRDSGPLGIPSHLPFTMGVPNMGGSVTTRSGLTFIAATQDNFLRAFETKTGREIWRARLPASGQATPAIYRSHASGRQFIVIAAGGHPALMTTPGNAIVAFALPRSH
jgi:quinoprotein glucose dehydrogenase